jgi:hypothetical protein
MHYCYTVHNLNDIHSLRCVAHGEIAVLSPYVARLVAASAIRGANGESLTTAVAVDAKAQTDFSLAVGFAVHDVVLDPSYKILHWTPAYRASEQGGSSRQRRTSRM